VSERDTSTGETEMTVKQIETKQTEENKKFEVAKQIRELIDQAKKGQEDPDVFEEGVIALVCDE